MLSIIYEEIKHSVGHLITKEAVIMVIIFLFPVSCLVGGLTFPLAAPLPSMTVIINIEERIL
jgi:uncharacterized membrane protein